MMHAEPGVMVEMSVRQANELAKLLRLYAGYAGMRVCYRIEELTDGMHDLESLVVVIDRAI